MPVYVSVCVRVCVCVCEVLCLDLFLRCILLVVKCRGGVCVYVLAQ